MILFLPPNPTLNLKDSPLNLLEIFGFKHPARDSFEFPGKEITLNLLNGDYFESPKKDFFEYPRRDFF